MNKLIIKYLLSEVHLVFLLKDSYYLLLKVTQKLYKIERNNKITDLVKERKSIFNAHLKEHT